MATPPQEAPARVTTHDGHHAVETTLRAILDITVEGVITINERGTIEVFNRAAEQIFGFTADEVVGQNVATLMPSPDRERHDRYLADYLKTGKAKIIGAGREVVGLRKDGRTIPMELFVKEVRLPDRRLFAGVVRDVSERKAAAAEIREQRDFAERVLAAAQSIILVLDPVGRIVRFNPYMEQLSGYRLEEVKGRDWFETFLPARDRRETRDLFQRCLTELDVKGKINALVTRSREERQISWWSKRLTRGDGRVTGVLAVGHDITDILQAQQHSIQSERLSAIGEAMTGLAHESRNALQRSQACLEMLKMVVASNEEALRLIAGTQRAQDDLHRLYEEVREYATPVYVDPQPHDVSAILRAAWQNLAPQREERSAELVEQRGNADLNCHVDEFALRQVFRNILDNALAACSDPVEIRAVFSEVRDEARGDALAVTIADNGPGLPPIAGQRVFEPFFTTKTHGTGLGMAISRRLIEAHHGTIQVGPDHGPGAAFTITLPRESR